MDSTGMDPIDVEPFNMDYFEPQLCDMESFDMDPLYMGALYMEPVNMCLLNMKRLGIKPIDKTPSSVAMESSSISHSNATANTSQQKRRRDSIIDPASGDNELPQPKRSRHTAPPSQQQSSASIDLTGHNDAQDVAPPRSAVMSAPAPATPPAPVASKPSKKRKRSEETSGAEKFAPPISYEEQMAVRAAGDKLIADQMAELEKSGFSNVGEVWNKPRKAKRKADRARYAAMRSTHE